MRDIKQKVKDRSIRRSLTCRALFPQGRSAVAAAYRIGEKLHNQNDGLTHDFTHKTGIKHSEIMLPGNAPREYAGRATLWNAVEKAEEKSTQRDTASTAQEIVIALPNELTLDEQRELTRGFVRDNFTNNGMYADFSIRVSSHGHRLDDFQDKETNDIAISIETELQASPKTR